MVASFSPVGPAVDLMAPGVSITSAVPGGGTATLNGTSMAAPHVAGAWAILRQEHPSASVSEILAILRATAVPVSGSGYSDMRRINLGKAVTAGPFVTQEFMINNDGTAVLSVLSVQLETQVPWIRWTPEAPFDVAPGGAKRVVGDGGLRGRPVRDHHEPADRRLDRRGREPLPERRQPRHRQGGVLPPDADAHGERRRSPTPRP